MTSERRRCSCRLPLKLRITDAHCWKAQEKKRWQSKNANRSSRCGAHAREGLAMRGACRALWKATPVEIRHDLPDALAFAVIFSSASPLLLLDEELLVVASSASFCIAFNLEQSQTNGSVISQLGEVEWSAPQLGILSPPPLTPPLTCRRTRWTSYGRDSLRGGC